MGQQHAKIRACASCEWIFRTEGDLTCPQCSFGSYGARFVYGDAAYRYAVTQKPWKDKKLFNYSMALNKLIRDACKESNQ